MRLTTVFQPPKAPMRQVTLPSIARAVTVSTLLTLALATVARAQSCETRSTPQPPAVVELYTSEGCSSCPPADRWLSALKGRDDVLALGFHVNYWDKLGWPDRFANAAITDRQRRLQQASGAAYVYTPQVMLNGRDLPAWSRAGLPRLPTSTVAVTMVRQGNTVRASVTMDNVPGATTSLSGAPSLSGYWVVLEDGHSTRVKLGENAGERLAHDHVVTLYRPVAAWRVGSSTPALTLDLPATTASSRRVAFVVTDAVDGKPLQAALLGC